MSSESKADTDDLLVRFLLDEMSEEERVQIENRFLADNEFFESLLAAESALLDQYAQGKLSGHKLKQAQSLFESSSSQKRDVEFTKELIAAVRETHVANDLVAAASVAPQVLQSPVAGSNVTRFGWALALLLCISLLIWTVFLYSSRRSLEAQRLAAERSAQEARQKLNEQLETGGELNKQLQAEIERRTQAEELLAQMQTRQPPEITSILLFSAASERGGQGDGIAKFKPGSRLVQIQLYVDEPEKYKRYRVKLSTVSNREIWKNDSIGADQIRHDRLSLLLQAQLFEHEDYKIQLKGQAADGSFVYVADYTFKVRK
jgi:hypothetical protein